MKLVVTGIDSNKYRTFLFAKSFLKKLTQKHFFSTSFAKYLLSSKLQEKSLAMQYAFQRKIPCSFPYMKKTSECPKFVFKKLDVFMPFSKSIELFVDKNVANIQQETNVVYCSLK